MSSPVPPRGTQSEGATRAGTPAPDPSTASTGELIGQLSDQLTRLVHDEVRLAQAEVTQKAKKLGVGIALFGGAGVVAPLGKKDVQQAAPPLPTDTLASVQAGIDTVKQGIAR